MIIPYSFIMNLTNRTPTRSHEDIFMIEDTPEVMQLNFPPTEIEGTPDYTFLPADDKQLQHFLYPYDENRREYQFEIVEECFRQNTLVCLPTGSGKTLIAAVVIMNFRRWYPKGKIIFMAPFRTLVNQQIDACMSKTDIKEEDVCILTGTTFSGNRSQLWEEKSIFFCTPQIVQNDISKKILNPCSICLIIFDEAHHASGSYAYVNVVRMIASYSSQFRVIGLSATPGNDVDKIQAVIYNLMISKIIYKDEEDVEIAKYQHKTNVEIVKVPLGNDESKLEDYLCKCLTTFAEPLAEKGYIKLSSSPKWMTHGIVWRAMDQFKNNNNRFQIPNFFKIIDNFGTLLSLAIMQEKLTKYGATLLNESIKDYIKKKKETECKKKLVSMPAFQQLQRDCETSKNVSHPKLAKLSEILGDFYSENSNSRAIVFTKYREAALAIVECLKKVKGVKASIFIGKSDTRKNHGLDETTQIEILSLFKHGNINCIVATSVAEEGLDIGEVDLIICYDTSSSPLTTVQRMGRTGRKRSGRVIFLMSEGYEEKNLEKAQYSRALIKRKLTSALGNFILYKPERPNLPIPESCVAFNVNCARPEKDNRSNILTDMNKKRKKNNENEVLSKTEMTRLQCCYDSSLKYRNMCINDGSLLYDHGYTIISHSTESNLLSSMKNKFSLSLDIEKQLSDIIKEVENLNKDTNKHNKPREKSNDPFWIDDSSDSSEDDIEEINDPKGNENTSPTTSPLLSIQANSGQPLFSISQITPPHQQQPLISLNKRQIDAQKPTKKHQNRTTATKENTVKIKKQIQKQLFDENVNSIQVHNKNSAKFISARQLDKMKQTSLFSFVSNNDNDCINVSQPSAITNQYSPNLELKTKRFLDSDSDDSDDTILDENPNNNNYTEVNIASNVSKTSNYQKKSQTSFLSDYDYDDNGSEIEEIISQSEQTFIKNSSSDEQAESECPDFLALKKEIGKKSNIDFLKDTELDSIDLDEYFK